MSIEINALIQAQILAHAEVCYPNESCGFVLGSLHGNDESKGSRYCPSANTMEDKNRRFLIDPLEYQVIEDRADEEGLAIIAIVHSHPDHPDLPSEFDRQHAWPGLSYIIISVLGGKAQSYRSWRLTEDHSVFNDEDILVGGR